MGTKRIPVLTDGEARIMAVLWSRQPATVADVVAGLRRRHPISYSTAQTMLRILEEKGYVRHDKVGRAFTYRAVVDQRQARTRALGQLLHRLFDGSRAQLVMNILEDGEIDAAELERLRQLIRKA